MTNELPVDLDTSEKANNFLHAEEALGEARVARVLVVTLTEENNDWACWSINGCHQCTADLHEGDQGWVWGRPVSNDPGCQYLTLETYCSEECVDAALAEWSKELEVDLYTGFFTL